MFGGSDGDFLVRSFFQSRGQYSPSSDLRLGWDYQGGGKLFFSRGERDALIQYAEFPLAWQITPGFEISLTPDFKYQNERDKVDATFQDINEDYLSTTTRLNLRFPLSNAWTVEPSGSFTYFRFEPTQSYGFFRETGGATLQKTIGSVFAYGAHYSYTWQQFAAGGRKDQEHQVSGFLQYLRAPVLSLRYTFERNDSSTAAYSFDNHRVTALISVPMFPRDPDDVSEDEPGIPPALIAVHVLGTLQFKQFPSVFDYTPEGQRFLLTGSEDENFNSFVVKVSVHPFVRWAFETKFTRYSNEFSSQQAAFRRFLIYAGVRYTF
ncbi:MAG: hypothetical protein V1495_08660 [Pseudomonadota bacterium]